MSWLHIPFIFAVMRIASRRDTVGASQQRLWMLRWKSADLSIWQIHPESEHWKADWELRRGYQVQALAQTYSLLTMMDIAYRTFGIEGSKMDHWTGLVVSVQNLLRNWKRSDENRYK